MNLQQYTCMRDKLEDLQQQANVAEGNLQQLHRQLYDLTDCESMKEVQKKIKKMTEEVEREDREVQKSLLEFEKKFGEKL